MANEGHPPRTIGAYRVAVKVSRNRHILVEGTDDRSILERLFAVLAKSGKVATPVNIDTAESLASPAGQILGNREKVEAVCSGLDPNTTSGFAGFVDRELRGFDLHATEIADNLARHYVDGLLVWSRGHSIENYVLSFPVFSHAIQCYTDCGACYSALEKLGSVYIAVLRLACAISLAATDNGCLASIRDCIRWNDLRLEMTPPIDEAAWKKHLRSVRPALVPDVIYKSVDDWYRKLSSCDEAVPQWLCDGHIGLSMCLAAYQRCVFDVTGDSTEAQKSLQAKRRLYVLGGAVKWAEMACVGQAVWPEELISLLSA